LSEQPTQHYSAERAPEFESGDELHLHMSGFEKYDAAKIAEVRDMPVMREPTPEELSIMAIRNAGLQLSNLHFVRTEYMKADES
jgi:hypothetical protein